MTTYDVEPTLDEVEFERLYRLHAGDVYRYALSVMRNAADAEDVTQTTFMNAWRALRRGEQPRSPHNWFIAIAHNVCRLRFRHVSRRPREVAFEPELAEAAEIESASAQDVLDALAELPLNQREALVMRELEGRSYVEIAGIMGVSRSAVETLIFRARRSLRIRRDALGSLGLLPLPSWLVSLFRGRGALESGAGAALGSGAALKAVALITAGLVAAGTAEETVRADTKPSLRGVATASIELSGLAPVQAATPTDSVQVQGIGLAPVATSIPGRKHLQRLSIDAREGAATPAAAGTPPGVDPEPRTAGPSSAPSSPPAPRSSP
ncbi:MAG: RNA polymerase sigma factor, partial [Gaiellaceae bacterium]